MFTIGDKTVPKIHDYYQRRIFGVLCELNAEDAPLRCTHDVVNYTVTDIDDFSAIIRAL